MCQIRCWIEDGVCFGGVVFEARSLMSRHFFVLTHSLMHAYAKVCGARPASVKVIKRTCIPFGGLAVALRAVGTAGGGSGPPSASRVASWAGGQAVRLHMLVEAVPVSNTKAKRLSASEAAF